MCRGYVQSKNLNHLLLKIYIKKKGKILFLYCIKVMDFNSVQTAKILPKDSQGVLETRIRVELTSEIVGTVNVTDYP